MPFNVAVFVNSTAGLVPPARNGQIEEGFRPASLR